MIELKKREKDPPTLERDEVQGTDALYPRLESISFYDLAEGVIDMHRARLLMEALFEKAKGGNVSALRLFLEYTVGKTIAQPEREAQQLDTCAFADRIDKVYGDIDE